MNSESISLLAYEVEAYRAERKIKRIVIGWTSSVVILGAAIVAVIVA